MSKNTKELSRDSKEKGFKVYKFIVNVFVIVLLVLLYRSLYVNLDGLHWMYGGGVLWFILRLAGFASRERKARALGIPVTEYVEKRTDKLNNKND